MKAITITHRPEVGGMAGALKLAEVVRPEPRSREVLVKVVASSINIDDIHFAEGTMYGGLPISPKPSAAKPFIPGVDVSGIVEVVGSKVNRFKPDDEVFGIHNPTNRMGAWGEYCCVHEDRLMSKPGYLNHQEAAACALAGLVACSAVAQHRQVQAGQKCLVVGASGSIGNLAVQMAKALGANVTGVCSTKNVSLVKSLGADEVIDYTTESLAEALSKEGDSKMDVAIDCVGGREIEADALKVLKKSGTFVTLVGPVRYIGETSLGWLGIGKMFFYLFQRIVSSTFLGPKYKLMGPSKATYPVLLSTLETHRIKPLIDREISLMETEIRDAIAYVATHRARGKVIINVSPH